MLSRLSLTNFRSYSEHQVELDPKLTVVVGPNATGKTNLLEAVFVLATTKSFRAKDAELIHHDQDFYRITANTPDGEIGLGYQKTNQATEKRAYHEGVKQPLIRHLTKLKVVLFEPNDIQLVLGSPDRRRRYLDFILTQTDPNYLSLTHRYKRVLQQRNRLLSDWNGDTSELFAWNIKLAELAADIDAARRQVVDHINNLAMEGYAKIAGHAEPVELRYIGTADPVDYPSHFIRLLETNQARDLGAGFTTIGPHRDDIEINFKNADITSVASRGEIRTVVLALKLAELTYIKQKTGIPPILLLDDVFSELDDQRRSLLSQAFEGHQVIITTTDGDMADQLDAHIIKTTSQAKV